MSISVSGVAGVGSTNPYAALVQAQQNAANSAFGSNDPSSLPSTAAAYSLYERPGLLTGLTKWDGSQTPGSQRPAAAADTGAAPNTPKYSFNPFDKKSWDSSWKTTPAKPAPTGATGSSSGATGAPSSTSPSDGVQTGTGVVVPLPKYSFNPFDQKSWDVTPPKGSSVDTLA